eukprot:1140961-Pelagomonas_calceolata.AAC.1
MSIRMCANYMLRADVDSSTETAISIVVVVLNVALKLFVQFLSAREMQWTRSEMPQVAQAPHNRGNRGCELRDAFEAGLVELLGVQTQAKLLSHLKVQLLALFFHAMIGWHILRIWPLQRAADF